MLVSTESDFALCKSVQSHLKIVNTNVNALAPVSQRFSVAFVVDPTTMLNSAEPDSGLLNTAGSIYFMHISAKIKKFAIL